MGAPFGFSRTDMDNSAGRSFFLRINSIPKAATYRLEKVHPTRVLPAPSVGHVQYHNRDAKLLVVILRRPTFNRVAVNFINNGDACLLRHGYYKANGIPHKSRR